MMNNIYSRPMFQTPQRRAGGGIMAGVAPINMTSEPVYMDEGGSVSGFLKEQSSASEDGIFGVLDDQPVTLRDATDFFLVDPNDPVDVAIASLSAALLVFPPAAAAATLARYGWKGKKAFEKLAEAQKRFAPSSVDKGNAAIDFAKRRVLPELESIEGGLNLIPGARFGAYETNRALSAGVQAAFDPEIQETVSSIGDSVGELGDLAPIYAEQKYDEYFGTPSLVPDSTAPLIAEVEAEDNGGLANLATSIAEARDMKAATFRKDDKELAAVTKEDLEESGFDSLTDYLNNMEFDEDIGRYSRKVVGKANGGIMRLKDGSGPNGVEEKVIPPEIEGILDKWDLSLEEFLEFKDEKKQAYIKSYKDSLGINKFLKTNPVAEGIASALDLINMVPEGIESLYDAAKYSDFGRVVGFSDPDQERPDDDASFTEDIERIRAARAPSLDEVNALIPAPVEALEEKPKQIIEAEEKPGFIETAWGAIKDYHGMGGTSENEKNAQRVANNTRREYGTSWQEVYNKALSGLELNDAQVNQANAAGTSQVDEFVQSIKRYRPDIKDSEALDLFLSTKSRTTGQFNQKDLVELITVFYENIVDPANYTSKAQFDKESEAGVFPSSTTFDQWAMIKAKENANNLISDSSPADSSGSKIMIGADGKKII